MSIDGQKVRKSGSRVAAVFLACTVAVSTPIAAADVVTGRHVLTVKRCGGRTTMQRATHRLAKATAARAVVGTGTGVVAVVAAREERTSLS